MNEIPTAEVTAGRLTSTPVVAVTIDHSPAAAWEAMRQRRVHHVAVLEDLGPADLGPADLVAAGSARVSPAEWHDVEHG